MKLLQIRILHIAEDYRTVRLRIKLILFYRFFFIIIIINANHLVMLLDIRQK